MDEFSLGNGFGFSVRSAQAVALAAFTPVSFAVAPDAYSGLIQMVGYSGYGDKHNTFAGRYPS